MERPKLGLRQGYVRKIEVGHDSVLQTDATLRKDVEAQVSKVGGVIA